MVYVSICALDTGMRPSVNVTGKGILESLLCSFQLNRMAENYLRTRLWRHRTHKSKVRRVLKEKHESKL